MLKTNALSVYAECNLLSAVVFNSRIFPFSLSQTDAPSTRIRLFFNLADASATFWIRSPERKLLNPLCIRTRVEAKSGYFFVNWRHKIEPSCLPWIFKTVQTKKKLRIQKYPDTCGRANSIGTRIPVGVEIFVSRKRKLRFKNIRTLVDGA